MMKLQDRVILNIYIVWNTIVIYFYTLFKPLFSPCFCINVISPLYQAVQGQHERCVSILLENHAEPNLVDINGNTALHLTANIPSISTAVLLLEHEANINAQNKVLLVLPLLQIGNVQN